MEFLSKPDLTLYNLVYNTVRAHGLENHVFNLFSSGVELVRDEVCFFGKIY